MDQWVGVDCEACGGRYTIEIIDVVDLGSNPLLRERLMRGTLNFGLCPHCGVGAPIDHAFLVFDPVAGRTILFVPDGGEASAVDAAILRNILSIYRTADSQPYLENQAEVGEWDELVTLLAESVAR